MIFTLLTVLLLNEKYKPLNVKSNFTLSISYNYLILYTAIYVWVLPTLNQSIWLFLH